MRWAIIITVILSELNRGNENNKHHTVHTLDVVTEEILELREREHSISNEILIIKYKTVPLWYNCSGDNRDARALIGRQSRYILL